MKIALWKFRILRTILPPWRLLISIYISFAAPLAAVSAFVTIYRPKWLPETEGIKILIALIIIGFIIGVCRVFPKTHIRLSIKNTNTQVEIVFGDLFTQEGQKAIPVNEFFDTELGDCVSDKSVHGQLVVQAYKGDSHTLDEQILKSLLGKNAEEVKRTKGKLSKYPIGTTAVIGDSPANRFLLIALCHTDITTLSAYADVVDLWITLSSLWEAIRNNSNGYPVNIPLFGGGFAKIRLSPQQLLEIMLLSLVMEAKSKEISTVPIRIILHPAIFNKIDLSAISKVWS